MNYHKISKNLIDIEKNFYIYLKDFNQNKLFKKNTNIYLKKDKNELKIKWKKISLLFKKLKFIINSSSFSFFFKRDYNQFIIKYYATILYYNMTIEIQESFKSHEDFIRQFLDENYKENYSSIARYIYRANFLYYLNYPKEFLNIIKDKIDNNLIWMIEKQKNYKINFEFDYKNIFYYLKFRIENILYIFIKYIWIFLSKIKFKNKWIKEKNIINEFYKIWKPWDIILTRLNFIATNISIPGFWKHMSMYLWTWEYLKSNFKDPIFNKLDKNKHYIIESTWKWVTIEEFEDFVSTVNYLWLFRTTFWDNKIKNAIIKTSKMLNKNYDYLFNYYSDTSFVCSELITKAYLKESEIDQGLSIQLEKVTWRLTYPPNNLVIKALNEKDDKEKEIYPVFFIDYDLKNKLYFIWDNETLLKSYKRSRFSFLLNK